MTIRFTAARLLLAAICGGALLCAPVVTAPSAHAACNAGQISDPVTGICWSQSATNLGITGTGGVCLPGRLGLCMAALQNSQVPKINLPPTAGPNRVDASWP